ncbi:MAG: phosphoribosyltransferase family protein [Gemmatimonadaceae bacterium]
MTHAPKVLIDEKRINARVQEMAQAISRDFDGKHLEVICTLGGSITFTADLVRHLTVLTTQHYLGFQSYGGQGKSGEVRVTLDVASPLEGKHLLLVEGAVISGRTPRYVIEMLRLRSPASVALCTLVLKPKALAVELPLKYVGFELGDEVAAGYGMGHGPERALPYVVESPPSPKH